MLNVLTKFGKVIVLLTVLIVLNPHRAVLIPFSLLAAFGSFLAGKLEDLCQWTSDKVDFAKDKFWLFGKPINKKLDEEMAELNRMVAEVDKKLKADR
ncbi:hypothetical protein HL10_gp045 [Cronobacter phage CR8]|uniref:Uncharacterized protein n=1 Tax=Cronobacter phage CR8 TaxID=1327934 RepID=A0A060ACE2_9CAUD|nr:hypothetical protein HL10_gp045 [Cronobacter phage CR8]AIA64575.1 hypothetical protein CR8_045 [Cronobacter phage CR8]